MTISQILEKNYKILKDAKIELYILDAEILLVFVLKKSREYILAHPDKKLSIFQITHYQLLVNKRIKGSPVAYLIGHKEFYGLDFIVNKHTLVPRPETELVVKEALIATRSLLKALGGLIIIDVGTGSGCIIISIIKSLIIDSKFNSENSGQNLKFFALDISKKALKIARKNAKQFKVDKKIEFLQGNLLKPILSKVKNQKSIVILANLPYLTPFQVKNSPSIQKEPKSALIAGNDGLKYYRKLFSQIKESELTKCYILCEIDPSQNKSIKLLAKKYFPISNIDIKKDLSKKDRLAIVEII